MFLNLLSGEKIRNHYYIESTFKEFDQINGMYMCYLTSRSFHRVAVIRSVHDTCPQVMDRTGGSFWQSFKSSPTDDNTLNTSGQEMPIRQNIITRSAVITFWLMALSSRTVNYLPSIAQVSGSVNKKGISVDSNQPCWIFWLDVTTVAGCYWLDVTGWMLLL